MPRLERPHARHQKVDCGRCSGQDETRDLGWHNGFVFMIHVVFSRCSCASLRNIMKNPWNHRKEEKYDKIHRKIVVAHMHFTARVFCGKQESKTTLLRIMANIWACDPLLSFPVCQFINFVVWGSQANTFGQIYGWRLPVAFHFCLLPNVGIISNIAISTGVVMAWSVQKGYLNHHRNLKQFDTIWFVYDLPGGDRAVLNWNTSKRVTLYHSPTWNAPLFVGPPMHSSLQTRQPLKFPHYVPINFLWENILMTMVNRWVATFDGWTSICDRP